MATSLSQWSALVGTFLPLIIAFIKREKWSKRTQTIFAVLVCFVAAFVTTYFEGTLNFHQFAQSLIVVFVLTKTTYLAVWKPTGIADAASKSTG